MASKQQNMTRYGIGLFFIGIIIGLIFCSLVIWGDLESFLFTSGVPVETKLNNLNCPVLMTYNEKGVISATIPNPTDKDVDRLVRATVTDGFVLLTRQIETRPIIPAKGEVKLEWEIEPEDAAYDRIILFRVHVFSRLSHKSAGNYCGVVVVDVPLLTVVQVLLLVAIFGAALVVTGRLIWAKTTEKNDVLIKKRTKAMDALTGIVLITFICSILGYWGLGLGVFLLGVIMLGTTIGFYTSK